jgi:hypothetical protein
MSVSAAQLVAVVKTEGVPQGQAELEKMSGAVEKTQGGFKSMLGNALSFAAGQAVFMAVGSSVGFLKDQLSACFTESENAQAGMAQTNQVLKSTHDASGMTSQAIADLAGNLSHLTKFSDDTVQASENMLLTFTNIGKKVFPDATRATLDMSQALGQDTKSSAIQLGKALNDPIAGITALSRVGVTFSQVQKDQIKHFMDTNNIAGAQGVILKELQKEFGGSAEAAGKTFGGQMAILNQRLDDVRQNIGDALLPQLVKLVGFVSNNIGPAFDNLGSIFSDVKGTLTQLGQIVKSVFADLGVKNPFASLSGSGESLKIVGKSFHEAMMTIQKDLSVINPQALVNGFKSIGSAIQSAYPGIKQVADIIGKELSADFQFALKWGKQISQWFNAEMLPAIKQAMPGFIALSKALINDLAPALAKAWAAGQQIYRLILADVIPVFEKVAPIVVKLAGYLANNLAKAIVFLTPYFNQAVAAISAFAKEISDRVMPIVNNFFAALDKAMPTIKAIWNAAWPVMASVLKGAWDIIVGVVKIAWALVSGIIKIGLDILSGNWKKAWEDLKTMLKGVWDGIKTVISGALQLVITMITGKATDIKNTIIKPFQDAYNFVSSLFGKLGGVVTDALNGVGKQVSGTLHTMHIPGFASGVENFSGGMAYVHAGEVITYLPPGSSVTPARTVNSMMHPQIIVQPPPIYLDGQRLTRAQMPYIANAIRHGVGGVH